ncbi:UvrD-helicase domain-containing protein [Aeromonas sp. MR7]|uniref:UvrD-helicase domain-containing protein n=1 Tax=Aeromonas sp. MR7 TaxID=2923419 RepID=UPI001F4A57EC|nr:UvrD-helicase domain-containing protein [Aeromonas sp. MR7]MCH7350266.1 UvrD-helicase domain-containing protein [Aeromonas sp. MR7]
MNNLKENSDLLATEKEIFYKLRSTLDNKTSFIFKAGAGSGKTFSLIQCLQHLIAYHSHMAMIQNQKFVCITYTNAAANEIKERLGNYSELCHISTIHDFLWETIKSQQNALIEIHKEKIESEISTLNLKLKEKNLLDWILSGSNHGDDFRSFSLNDENSNRLKKYSRSNEIMAEFSDELKSIGYTLKNNTGRFKESFKLLRLIEKLKQAKCKIEQGEINQIKYTPDINIDILYKMYFSHDTLLEYTHKLFNRYAVLKEIFIASHPFVLIDEFQDTHELVIKTFNLLQEHSKSKNYNFTVGYFGDEAQTIYVDGVGDKIYSLHKDLIEINKNINRRSFNEIIKVINSIRRSDPQQSIYNGADGGHVSAYKITNNLSLSIENIILRFCCEVIKDRPVDFLVLKNDSLAELSGFKDLYDSFKNFFRHDEVAQKTISTDPRRLHWCIRDIANLISPSRILEQSDESCPINSILPSSREHVTIKESREYISRLRELALVRHRNLGEYIQHLNKIITENPNDIMSDLIIQSKPRNLQELTISSLHDFIYNSLPENLSWDEETRTGFIERIINTDFQQFSKWHEYITASIKSSVRYHTCHGSKGLEYDNVVVVIENSFNRDPQYFERYFLTPEEYISQRNLLYVSCSRAIKNLYLLFADDISTYQDESEKIFGKTIDFIIQ